MRVPVGTAALAALLPTVLGPMSGCEPPLVCREPDVWVTNAEGVADGYCTIGLDRCEDGSTLSISCSNDTFSGDYDCTWSYVAAPMTFRSGSFTSPDLCTLDADAMAAAIDANVPYAVSIE